MGPVQYCELFLQGDVTRSVARCTHGETAQWDQFRCGCREISPNIVDSMGSDADDNIDNDGENNGDDGGL